MKKYLDGLNDLLAPRHDVGLLLLRLFIGTRLVYGVIDNVVSWQHMLAFAEFLENFGFPVPVASAVLSVYVQLIAGMGILTGFQIRLASILIVVNFVVALLMVHFPSGDSFEAMTPPLAMLFGAATLMFTGPGKFSLGNR